MQSDAERKMQLGGAKGERHAFYIGVAFYGGLIAFGILAAAKHYFTYGA